MNSHSAKATASTKGVGQSDRMVARVVALMAGGWFLLLLLSSAFVG